MLEFRWLTHNDEKMFEEYFTAWGEEQGSIVPSATNIKRYKSFQNFINNLEEPEKSLEYAKENNARYICLETGVDNVKAQGLYERMGMSVDNEVLH